MSRRCRPSVICATDQLQQISLTSSVLFGTCPAPDHCCTCPPWVQLLEFDTALYLGTLHEAIIAGPLLIATHHQIVMRIRLKVQGSIICALPAYQMRMCSTIICVLNSEKYLEIFLYKRNPTTTKISINCTTRLCAYKNNLRVLLYYGQLLFSSAEEMTSPAEEMTIRFILFNLWLWFRWQLRSTHICSTHIVFCNIQFGTSTVVIIISSCIIIIRGLVLSPLKYLIFKHRHVNF